MVTVKKTNSRVEIIIFIFGLSKLLYIYIYAQIERKIASVAVNYC